MSAQAPRILTSYEYPPIPDRNCDWVAWIDGREESGPYGRGATEAAAIADLRQLLEDVFTDDDAGTLPVGGSASPI